MENFRNYFLLLIVSVFLIGGFLFLLSYDSISLIKADDSRNVSGWAWSENIGWISFNCTNCEENPACDKQATCDGEHKNYGVNIEEPSGSFSSFSGYAWSENIGWIDFAPTSGYPSEPKNSARVDVDTGFVSGWARALAYGDGWDGWIKLRKGPDDSGPDYGVAIDTVTGDFKETYAWGGDVVGWLKFAGPVYKTTTSFDFNNAPNVKANSLSAVDTGYCSLPVGFILGWGFHDPDVEDIQGGYQVQISTDPGFTNIVHDTCPEPDTGTCKIIQAGRASFYTFTPINYSTTYYWRVKVADQHGRWSNDWSDWSGADPDYSFTTPLHQYPQPKFFIPQRITKDEVIQLCSIYEEGNCPNDLSTCYDASGQQISSPSCLGKTFSWSFVGAGLEFIEGDASSHNPKIRFTTDGDKTISLTITDDVGSCAESKNTKITKPLPRWKEIAP